MGTIILPILGMSKDEGFPGGSVVSICLPMQEMQVRSLGQENPLEEEISWYYCRKNPRTEEPGGLQSMGLQRVRHKSTKMSIGNSRGFPGDSDGKEPACNAGDPGLIPGLGRSPGEGNGYPLQDSCLKNSMDRGAWWAIVRGVAEPWTQLSKDEHR